MPMYYTFSYFGVSRSASIVTAYIMKKYEISYDDAFQRYVDEYFCNVFIIINMKLYFDV